MKMWMAFFSALLLCACAAYNGHGLKPGVDQLENVLEVMGQPAMRWQNPDGSVQLAYPRGPMGYHTFMVHIGSDGKLRQIENVLDEKTFSRIQPGMTEEDVLHISVHPIQAGRPILRRATSWLGNGAIAMHGTQRHAFMFCSTIARQRCARP